ncbi:MAG: dihydropteroate synthase [Steroidobacteraceae bacterium]
MPRVMGILNVTPDSFSDGGRFVDLARAVEHGLAMVAAGADIIDVGGESTRPGAQAVSEADEIDRVIPVIAALVAAGIPVSVDTSKAAVISAALSAGASMINDVRALQEPGALLAAAGGTAAICLMHMQGAPRTMQHDPQYTDVVREVRDFLSSRVEACVEAGVARERIAIDPGIGFGKRLEHNLALLAALPELQQLELPVLIGVSRKSMLSKLLGRGVEQRLAGSVAIATAASLAGVGILRVHDVAETVDAIRVAVALKAAGFHS